MKRFKNDDGSVATLAFAVFASVIVIASIIFIAAMANQQPTITDTYGNTLSSTSNSSQSLVTAATSEEEYSMVPLIFIIVTVFLCGVIFAAWVASKTGISV
jgi:uncharacterized integral membrane protein